MNLIAHYASPLGTLELQSTDGLKRKQQLLTLEQTHNDEKERRTD